MIQGALAGDGSNSGNRTVVVGVKLDSHCKELLTWTLVKVAQPGDVVLALHVLDKNEIVDGDGKSSLLSLVKGFDSILGVYDGFCNLKQVQLKLKICRGSSVRKILVREARAYSATHIIVGTAVRRHKIRSSASVAKYCANSFSKNCWVLAVNNGKVVFKRDGSPEHGADLEGMEFHKKNSLLGSVRWKFSKHSKVTDNEGAVQNSKKSLAETFLDSTERIEKQQCSICTGTTELPYTSCEQSGQDYSDDVDEENSLAIVLVSPVETASNSTSMSIIAIPESKPGWPLLRHTISSNHQVSGRSFLRQLSVVQRAMQLPCRDLPWIAETINKQCGNDQSQEPSSGLDGENGAIVLLDAGIGTSPPSTEPCLKGIPKELEELSEKYSCSCRLFSYQDLVVATSNFLPENLIGKGGSSQVYRCCLSDEKELAVKILKPSENALKEFLLEIEIITTLNQKNIISLIGFCFEDGHLLLVYDLLSRGSLEENLHGSRKDPFVFGWTERFRVALGVADALDYLHNNVQPVIHRDVKSSNVLLSDDFEPQLSDFGLATWASPTSSHITCTDVAGTFGYLAPEYFMYGKVNEKIDVFSFGVVLLELLSGRKPISSDLPKGRESLVMWATPILNSGKVSQLLDPSLDNKYDQDQMERMVLAATLCVRRAPRARPLMNTVLKLLKGDNNVLKWARLEVNASVTPDSLDNETILGSVLQSHLNLALLDVEDDSLSMSSMEQNVSLEDYLSGRWSRSSSFD